MDDPNVDIIMPWFVFQDDPLEETIVDVLAGFQKLKKKPILVGAMGGPFTRKIAAEIESKNIPVYDFVSTWSTAAEALQNGNLCDLPDHTKDWYSSNY